MESEHIKLVAFIRAAEFLSPRESLSLLTLNSFFKSHLETPSWKREIVLSQLSLRTHSRISDEDYQAVLESEFGVLASDYATAYQKLKKSFNFLKNPYGAEGFNYWSIDTKRGWAIETFGTYGGRSHVFVGTYYWCELTQTVKVENSHERTAVAFAFIARRWDCGAVGELKATTFQKRGKRQVEHTTGQVICSPSTTEDCSSLTWTKIKLNFPVPQYTTSISVTIRSKDTQYWAGNYGCRFGYTALLLS